MTDDELAKKMAALEAEVRAARSARGALSGSVASTPPSQPLSEKPATSLSRRAPAAPPSARDATSAKPKSKLASAALSMLFGPVGWLYAGAWKEAIPGAVAYLVIASCASLLTRFLPTLILLPLFTVGLPLSGIIGYLYAAEHNKRGQRPALLLASTDAPRDPA